MYQQASIGFVIVLVIIVYILKPLFKIFIDSIEKRYKDNDDKEK
mgnify:CR=1 FL=1